MKKSNLLNVSERMKRCVIKYYVISHGHIGDGYREIQETVLTGVFSGP